MSCYEWERGTIIIPTKEWAGFRKGLLEAWNAKQLELLEKATQLHGQFVAALKGPVSVRSAALEELCRRHRLGEDGDESQTLFALLVDSDRRTQPVTRTLKKCPTKKDLKLFAVSKNAILELDGAQVELRNEDHTVRWNVFENNHARQYAHEHWFAKMLFGRLGRITWVRGSGGTIVGNDEYHSDSDHPGGGGNYVVREYRPLTAKETRAKVLTHSWVSR